MKTNLSKSLILLGGAVAYWVIPGFLGITLSYSPAEEKFFIISSVVSFVALAFSSFFAFKSLNRGESKIWGILILIIDLLLILILYFLTVLSLTLSGMAF